MHRRPLLPVLASAILTLIAVASFNPTASAVVEGNPVIRVIGGRDATVDEFPYIAALVRSDGNTPVDDMVCGASIISPSWALTAAHCVTDRDDEYPNTYPGPTIDYVGPEALEIVTGITSLEDTGGQRLAVASIHPHPESTGIDNDFDFALVRLARPTNAPAVSLIDSGTMSLESAGTQVTVAGWGWTEDGYPTDLKAATFPIISDSTCKSIYHEGRTAPSGEPTEFRAQSMLCAGKLQGGVDSCSGDSGGPLVATPNGSAHRLVGVVSWGDACAEPNQPGVYSRVSAAKQWILRSIRFGPFGPDGVAFTVQQYADMAGRWPTATELDQSVTAFKSTNSPAPSQLVSNLLAAPAWRDIAPPIARLYRATFLRNPETGGFSYWMGPGRGGRNLIAIASFFTESPEFKNRYGNLDDGEFVDLLYRNVFERDPDARGRAFWVGRLGDGLTRGTLLAQLSDSPEYRNRTAATINTLTTWFGLNRMVPTAAQISANSGLTTASLIEKILTSVGYANRFGG